VIRILGVSGSLRRGSFNTALLRAAGALLPAGAALEPASIAGIPLYDGDVEATEGIPPAVHTLKERIVACDALLLVTPEYNGSIPGVAKNAIDWLSRPMGDIERVFGGRVVGVIGASPGPRGTVGAQVAWLPVLRVLGTRPWFGATLYVANAARVFDAEGELTDAGDRERLRRYLDGFVQYVSLMQVAARCST
jgi:chromate reductase, NAD(P)H dehydrogenase (quinone)